MGQDAHRHLRELEVRLSSIVASPGGNDPLRPIVLASELEPAIARGHGRAPDRLRRALSERSLLLGLLLLLLCAHAVFVHYRLSSADQASARAEARLAEMQAGLADIRISTDAAMAGAVRRTIDAERMITILAAPDARRLPLRDSSAPPAAIAGQVIWSRTHGVLVTAIQVPPAAGGEVYQVWGQTRTGPINLGPAFVDGQGRLSLLSESTLEMADEPTGFTVTREPAPGSRDPRGATILST